MEKNWGDTPSATLNVQIFVYSHIHVPVYKDF